MSLLLVFWHGLAGSYYQVSPPLLMALLTCAFYVLKNSLFFMTKYVINQFHFHGTFIAGDNFDIHDDGRVCEDFCGTLPGQRAGRDQADGEGHRIDRCAERVKTARCTR